MYDKIIYVEINNLMSEISLKDTKMRLKFISNRILFLFWSNEEFWKLFYEGGSKKHNNYILGLALRKLVKEKVIYILGLITFSFMLVCFENTLQLILPC